jgi:hypothetical protein
MVKRVSKVLKERLDLKVLKELLVLKEKRVTALA